MLNNNLVSKDYKYVVAVSGGVDSVALLNMLYKENFLKIVVVHVNHGIRPNSYKDEVLVSGLAKKYNYNYEHIELKLGPTANEAIARRERYNYLHQIKQKYNASAILTAHHRDDVIETCFINIIRGTGRSGVSSLKSNKDVVRPLLNVSKLEIINYAKENNLKWQEDSTNNDTTILRNKLRHTVIPKMSSMQKDQLLAIITQTEYKNSQIDKEIQTLLYKGLHKGQPVLKRSWFVTLPHDVSLEIIRILLLQNGAKNLDRPTVERLVIGSKTKPPGKHLQAGGVDVFLTKRSIRFKKCGKTDKKLV